MWSTVAKSGVRVHQTNILKAFCITEDYMGGRLKKNKKHILSSMCGAKPNPGHTSPNPVTIVKFGGCSGEQFFFRTLVFCQNWIWIEQHIEGHYKRIAKQCRRGYKYTADCFTVPKSFSLTVFIAAKGGYTKR